VTSPFVAEIRIFPFGFAPTGWAFCNGQIIPLSQNTALFSLLGTTYGGDGKTNFALPDMQGNSPMQPGQGAGLSLHDLGEVGGEQSVTLLESEMPSHPHALTADQRPANLDNPSPLNALARSSPNIYKTPTGAATVPLSDLAVGPAGGDQPHNNMQPFLTLNFCIALQGVYPPRT
jgi:microcystin-dependent protein